MRPVLPLSKSPFGQEQEGKKGFLVGWLAWYGRMGGTPEGERRALNPLSKKKGSFLLEIESHTLATMALSREKEGEEAFAGSPTYVTEWLGGGDIWPRDINSEIDFFSSPSYPLSTAYSYT